MSFYKQFKSLGKHSFIYSIAGIFTKLVGLVLMPLMTNTEYLSQTEYGIFGLAEGFLLIIPLICTLGLNNGFQRFFWDANYKDRQKELLFNTLFFMCGLFLVIFIFIIQWEDSLANLLFASTSYAYLLRLLFVVGFFTFINDVLTTLLKLREKSILYTSISMLYLTVMCALVVVNITYYKRGIEGIFEAQLIASVLNFLCLLPILIRNIKLKIDKTIIKEMLSYSLPLTLAAFSGILLSLTDKYTLRFLDSMPSVGYFSIASRLSNTVKMVLTTSVMSALIPIIYKKMGDADAFKFHEKTFKYIGILAIWFSLAFIMGRKELVEIFTSDPAYMVSISLVPVLVFALLFGLLKDIVVIGLAIEKKTKIIAMLIFITTAMNLILNIVLVILCQHIGIAAMMGTAFATLCMQLTFFLLCYYYSRKYYQARFHLASILIAVGIGMGLFVISIVSYSWPLYYSIPYRLVLLALFPVLLFATSVFTKGDLASLKQIRTDANNRYKKKN